MMNRVLRRGQTRDARAEQENIRRYANTLIGLQNRMRVLIRWTFSFVTRGRGARLITGELGTSAERVESADHDGAASYRQMTDVSATAAAAASTSRWQLPDRKNA